MCFCMSMCVCPYARVCFCMPVCLPVCTCVDGEYFVLKILVKDSNNIVLLFVSS